MKLFGAKVHVCQPLKTIVTMSIILDVAAAVRPLFYAKIPYALCKPGNFYKF